MKFLINTLAVVSILILSGCASIVNEAMVPISYHLAMALLVIAHLKTNVVHGEQNYLE